jgi:hypothetical protein
MHVAAIDGQIFIWIDTRRSSAQVALPITQQTIDFGIYPQVSQKSIQKNQRIGQV